MSAYTVYTDFAKNRYKSVPGAQHKRDTYPERPFCDLCGPWRGRLMVKLVSGEWRCKGCHEEER